MNEQRVLEVAIPGHSVRIRLEDGSKIVDVITGIDGKRIEFAWGSIPFSSIASITKEEDNGSALRNPV